jgi:hypothetical protein
MIMVIGVSLRPRVQTAPLPTTTLLKTGSFGKPPRLMASSRKIGMFPIEETARERLIITDPVAMGAESEHVRVGLSFSFSTNRRCKKLTAQFLWTKRQFEVVPVPQIRLASQLHTFREDFSAVVITI